MDGVFAGRRKDRSIAMEHEVGGEEEEAVEEAEEFWRRETR